MNNIIITKIFDGDWLFFIPEFFSFFIVLSLLTFSLIYKSNRNIINITINLSLLFYFYLFLLYSNLISYNFNIFNFLFISSYYIIFFKLFIISLSFIFILLSRSYLFYEQIKSYEYIILVNMAVLGMLLLISANDFLSFYISLELQSFCLYILATYKQFSNYSTEAGLKYFILGAVSSGLLLFGISLLYGFTGLTNFSDLILFFNLSFYNLDNFIFGGILLSFLLILIGFFFKIGAAPFHMWLPDVYEGSPTLTTAFFAIIPKLAVLSLLSRFSLLILNSFFFNWSIIFIICGLASTFIGTFGALAQVKIKRLLAYSAIAHVGFLLLALSVFNLNGLNSFLIYLIIYSILNVITFSIILSLRKANTYLKLKNITDLKSVIKSNNLLVIFFSLTLFSIAGVPPLAGFFSKMFIFFVTIQKEYYFITLSFLILSIISTFYYLRLIKIMFFDLNSNYIFLIPPTKSVAYIIVIFSYFNIFFFFFSNIFFLKINEIILNFI